MKTVTVVGASGLVGSTLVERLLQSKQYKVRPLIHDSGNAWRLSRLNITLHPADILSTDSIRNALQGSDIVVNCSRGSSDVMIRGVKNLLHVSRKLGIQRFVHISSTALFGNTFDRQVVDESAKIRPDRDTYGWKKYIQDNLVQKASSDKFTTVILCPPNITGPYSAFLYQLEQSLRSNTFAFVDDGKLGCSVVDVQNLAHAIVCALSARNVNGERIIISDTEPTTWKSFMRPLCNLIALKSDIPSISTKDAQTLANHSSAPRKSIIRAFRHLVSSDVRAALRKDPIWSSLHKVAVTGSKQLPSHVQNWLRGGRNTNGSVFSSKESDRFNHQMIAQQLRNVHFSSDKAKILIGYEQQVRFDESFSTYCAWHQSHFGLNSEFSTRLNVLNQ